MKFSLVSRVKDPYAMCFAFFKAVCRNKTPEMLAEAMGRRVRRTSYMKPKKYQPPSALYV
jgi:hypothetical protein